MSQMALRILHNGDYFEPPIKDGVKIEWERTGSPGKMTFTTVKIPNAGMSFSEGDPVWFYYDEKPVFAGYVFTKKRDREHHIEVVCYDQIRYLKNKFTYVFQKKTATQIIEALCNDYHLEIGEMDNTNYVISSLAEENKSALDIILGVLEDTLVNTGEMFTFYDDFGKLYLKNSINMHSDTLIVEDTAENFDYSSSIDDETYNSIVLYYKEDSNKITVYTASSENTISQWGLLRYFEEVKNKTIAQNKAVALLKLYNRKTRELKVTGAFGDTSVRGGTLIPVKLNLGDITTNNYLLVHKVTHNFENENYTMDLTLEGYWDDGLKQGYSTNTETLEFEAPVFSTSSGYSDNAAINKIISLANDQIGVKESPSGSNRQKYGAAYGTNGVPWCCQFIWWLFKESGYSNLFYGGGKTASCTTLMNYYRNKGKTSKTPQVGSLAFFNFNSDSKSEHIGIVVKVNNDGTVTTIEGNTGVGNDANGGQVMRRNRNKNLIITYAYPY